MRRWWWWWVAVMVQSLKVAALLTTMAPAGLPVERPQRCTYHKAYGMQGAYCSGLNLHSVPTTLKTNIEILELTFNRIRELRNTTFSRYTYLRFLYLGDNLIQNIDAHAFDPLTSLETLDLSLNGLSTIPAFILNLPSLRKLYMSENLLENLQRDLDAMEKPIKAPLTFLNIASCQLSAVPDFGIIPELEHLNISGNNIGNLHPGDFSKMCGLKNIDLTGSVRQGDTCSYRAITVWFTDREVTIIPDFYAFFNPDAEEGQQCQQPSKDDDRDHAECKSKVKSKMMDRSSKKMWLIIACCLGGFLLCLVLAFIYLHRRNVKQTKKIKKSPPFKEENVGNDTNLLSDVS